MPRPRKSTKHLKLKGAFKKDPARGRARSREPKTKGPLGRAPEYFRKDQEKIWLELSRTAPTKVLTIADRWLVELACVLMAKFRRNDMSGGEFSQLMQCLSRMGMTPADRSRVSASEEEGKQKNPFAAIRSGGRDDDEGDI